MTFTVALHVPHVQKFPIVFIVYVVVTVGVTGMFVLLRVGYVKFNHMMLGIIVANVALAYDALSIAVCPGIIGSELVVNVHVEGVLSTTCNTHVHVDCSILLFTIIVNV